MRLATVQFNESIRLGVLDGDELLLPGESAAPQTVEELLLDTDRELERLRRILQAPQDYSVTRLASKNVVFLPPVPRPSKIIAIGLNYADHAREAGAVRPKEPIVFAKFPSTLIGDGADIAWRRSQTARVDYEVELAIVIGREARMISRSDAPAYILGYTCANDVSARDLQFGDGQWTRGKSLDTFCPMGPSIVTVDEVRDPMNLRISCTVNEVTVQDSSTSEMFFDVYSIIEYCSQHFTLLPGDIILTGTPAGVGEFQIPQRSLVSGDVVTVSVENVGTLTNACKVYD